MNDVTGPYMAWPTRISLVGDSVSDCCITFKIHTDKATYKLFMARDGSQCQIPSVSAVGSLDDLKVLSFVLMRWLRRDIPLITRPQ